VHTKQQNDNTITFEILHVSHATCTPVNSVCKRCITAKADHSGQSANEYLYSPGKSGSNKKRK